MSKKTRLGSDPFTEEPLSFIRDTRKKKPDKPGAPPAGPGSGNERRATFIMREDQLEKIKALAYWERKPIKRILELALESYLKGKSIRPIPKGE